VTTATTVKPSLQDIILDALNDAYWSRRANVEECRACTRSPAGVLTCHEEDNALALSYEAARKQIEHSPAALESILAALSDEGQDDDRDR
jgi:hypothetical protein